MCACVCFTYIHVYLMIDNSCQERKKSVLLHNSCVKRWFTLLLFVTNMSLQFEKMGYGVCPPIMLNSWNT